MKKGIYRDQQQEDLRYPEHMIDVLNMRTSHRCQLADGWNNTAENDCKITKKQTKQGGIYIRSKFKRALAVIASAAVMGNTLLASMPMADYVGGIVGDDTSVDIGNISQGTDSVESIAINERISLTRSSAPMWVTTSTRTMMVSWRLMVKSSKREEK